MRMLLIVLVCLFPGLLKSQHVHFIYVQSDQQQLFYVKKAGDITSSSATGFLILAKLPSGTHQFVIGFPKNQWPEYDFLVELRSSDRGFALKNFDEKGWGLLDLQTAEIIMGRKIEVPKVQAPPEAPKSNDPFSVILASAVGDEGIRETGLIAMAVSRPGPVAVKTTPAPPVARKETQPEVPAPVITPPAEPKPVVAVAAPQPREGEKKVQEATTAAKASEPSGNAKTEPQAETRAEAPPVAKTEVQPAPGKTESLPELKSTPTVGSSIRKLSELKGSSRLELVYLDVTGNNTDTVDVTIEYADQGSPVQSQAAAVNRMNCTSVATEKDALALRKKVLALGEDEAMLDAMIKEIKARCYTTEHLRTMSYAFVNDRLRYRLFEACYPHIFDPGQFPTLEPLLSSDEYITRFRSLVKTN